jgi:hypothetical protein
LIAKPLLGGVAKVQGQTERHLGAKGSGGITRQSRFVLS